MMDEDQLRAFCRESAKGLDRHDFQPFHRQMLVEHVLACAPGWAAVPLEAALDHESVQRWMSARAQNTVSC